MSAVIVIDPDNHTERRGTWFRAFIADRPDADTYCTAFGYASGQGGPHRTIGACIAELRRFPSFRGMPVYRNGRKVATV